MEHDEMTQAELILLLETLAENIEAKAKTPQEAAEIIRSKAEALRQKSRPPAPAKPQGTHRDHPGADQ